MTLYEKAWQVVRKRIDDAAAAAGRDPSSIRVLAVSKGFSPEAIRAACMAGQRAFGENYVQEAIPKIDALADVPHIEWHMIGPLQSNKARLAAQRFGWIETIDRLRIATRLAETRDRGLAPLDILVQVNISGEPGKSGIAPDAAVALAKQVAQLPHLALRGFMGIAEAAPDRGIRRAQFRLLRQVFERAREHGLALDTLSMGMSDDLEDAVAEGATQLRIGSALFGPRPAAAGAARVTAMSSGR